MKYEALSTLPSLINVWLLLIIINDISQIA